MHYKNIYNVFYKRTRYRENTQREGEITVRDGEMPWLPLMCLLFLFLPFSLAGKGYIYRESIEVMVSIK